MSPPDPLHNRYLPRRYTERDLLGTTQDFTHIEVVDTETGAVVQFRDRGTEGLDSVQIDGLPAPDLDPWRSLYHGIRAQVRGTIPQRIHKAFREAATISLHQRWDGHRWLSHFRATGSGPSGLRTTIGHTNTERRAPFTPADVEIIQNDPPLFIHVTQDSTLPWLATTIRYLGFDRILAAATSLALSARKETLGLWLPAALYRLLPEATTEQPAHFQAELTLALDGVIALSEGDAPLLSVPEVQLDSADVPLPFFRTVPIPATCPPQLRASIDADGDGRVSNVNEAWHTYLLATTPAVRDPLSTAALQQLAGQLTRIAPDQASLQIGSSTIVIRRPATTTCSAIPRLFAVGEAMRSFGAPLVRQWASGVAGESAVTLLPLAPSSVTDRSLQTELWGTSTARPTRATALYAPDLNVLVTGCLSTVGGQYWIARHELGHVLDDWLEPHDADGNAPVLYSDRRHNLVAAHRSAAFLRALPAPHYHNPHEWIPYFMEDSDYWRLAQPALRALIGCAVTAAAPHRCADDRLQQYPAENDDMGSQRRGIATERSR